MPRVLTVARVDVAPEREAEYLAAVRELAALREGGGRHVWLFRSAGRANAFLEFSEGPGPVPPRTPDELRLERRLAELAPGSREWWEEVPLVAPGR